MDGKSGAGTQEPYCTIHRTVQAPNIKSRSTRSQNSKYAHHATTRETSKHVRIATRDFLATTSLSNLLLLIGFSKRSWSVALPRRYCSDKFSRRYCSSSPNTTEQLAKHSTTFPPLSTLHSAALQHNYFMRSAASHTTISPTLLRYNRNSRFHKTIIQNFQRRLPDASLCTSTLPRLPDARGIGRNRLLKTQTVP